MEIQLGLRSTEADGRAPGTGRPSTPPPDRNPAEALAARRAEQVESRIAQTEKQESRIAERRAQGAQQRSFEARLREQRAESARATNEPARGGTETQRMQIDEQKPEAEASAQAKPATGRAGTKVPVAANQPSAPAQPVQASAAAISNAEARPQDAAAAQAQTKAAREALPATVAPVQLPTPEATPLVLALAAEPALLADAEAAPAAADGATAPVAGANVGETTQLRGALAHEAAATQQREPALADLRLEAAEPARAGETDQARAQDARVASRERAADVLRQIGVQLSPATRTALIDLYPKELGRIHIRISVDEGRVRASLRAEKKETLETLEKHLPELRDQLSRAGLDAQELSLSLGFDGGRRGGARDESGQGRQTNLTDLRPATAAELASLSRRVARDGGVDTFA